MRAVAFDDRADAGRRLAPLVAEMCASREVHAPLIVGIPRGGVVVAAGVADVLNAPLAVLVVRKIGAPASPEVAVGAISASERWIDGDARRRTGTTAAAVQAVEHAERIELRRRVDAYGDDTALLRGRDVVIIDDGVAVGATARVACLQARADDARRVFLAVPVAPAGWVPPAGLVDGWVTLVAAPHFRAVGEFYRSFSQTTDAEVQDLRATHRRIRPA